MKYRTLIVGVFALMGFIGCAENNTTAPVADAQNAALQEEEMIAQISDMPVIAITSTVEDGLVHMREEEKLARDVYTHLAARYNNAVFSNIAQSEARHMAAMKVLLDRHSVADPVTSNAEGVFTDPKFTDLYTVLTQKGDLSLLDAYMVGATIEDLDISDLKALMAAPPPQDILFVYGNIERGSENHLRSFVTNIRAQNGSYTPQYISQTEFDSIVAGRNGRGRHH